MSKSANRGYSFEYSTIVEGQKILNANIEPRTQTWINDKGIEKYNSITSDEQQAMLDASNAIVNFLIEYEPWIQQKETEITYVGTIRGSNDVSDVRFSNIQNSFGVSLKSNHDAVRHPRISPTIDIARQWLGAPTDQQYMDEIRQIIENFFSYCSYNNITRYNQLDKNKLDSILYRPVTESFALMLHRVFTKSQGSEAIAYFLGYLIGNKNFYKAKADFNNREITIEAYDITGALGTKGRLKMPSRCHEVLVETGRNGMHNYISITFDQGWQLKMRLHNAERNIQNSLKWDVRFIGTPHDAWSTRFTF